MTVKIKGADYRAFFQDKGVWSDGVWFDDVLTVINGVEFGMDDNLDEESDLKDEDRVEVHGGVIYANQDDRVGKSYETALRNWLKRRDTETLIVEVPKAKAAELRALLKDMKGVKFR